jgi:multiple sugar transport system substrate-binding protein
MNMTKRAILPVTIVAALSLATACGNTGAVKDSKEGASTPAPAQKSIDRNEAFKIVFFNATGSNETYFRQNTEPYMKKVFPNVTVEYIQTGKGQTINDLVTAGTIPDIMLINSTQVLQYDKMDLLADITPLAKANNVDLNRYNDNMIATVKKYAPNGELFALPWSHLPMSLYYNKSIFDKFGVAYPKDGMTWDDVAELTRKVSRTEGGVKYRGFDINRSYIKLNQLSLTYIDPKAEKANVNTDAWKDMYSTLTGLFRIPGNELPDKFPSAENAFLKDLNVAMLVTYGQFPSPENTELVQKWENIDLVTLPTFKSAPGIGNQYSGASLAISKTSKFKDQAVLLLAGATSDEAEKHGASIARYPTIKNKEALDFFGQGTPLLLARNMKSPQKHKVATTVSATQYDDLANPIMIKAFDDAATGKTDVVTALREADEKINQMIAQEKTKTK